MIRWTFGFKEFPIHVTTEVDAEDARIKEAVSDPDKLLAIEGNDNLSIFLNLRQTYVIMRQIVSPTDPGFNLPYPEKNGEKALPDVQDGPADEE